MTTMNFMQMVRYFLNTRKDEECSRLYTMLEEEYDYLTSDEYITEQLMNEDEDYEFYADGKEY